MPAMTTAMALGPGCRGSDAAFRHETTEEGPEEAGIIIDNRPGGCSLQIKLLFLDLPRVFHNVLSPIID